ncbi:MAG: TetR/AcrR family transcriptional regulator [Okeania sp. SIO3I5]|uniref:TetR/AcrR family transcriptional regulator n=1 Tax=Okeania sp. SIO3I5 TaxID=2607805 RepID=UPI0013B8C4F2|nr:TetR/AcrR family transcriptional regulator [Okeania sp. SIO3I5]NEQ36748.1 TetR/AcrR family transcriptional regulator [Okeania sp. SIO3I5]
MAKIKREEKLQRSAVDKAEQILRGAIPEFLKNGYACTSMDKVAKAAGVSKQTLYSHFTDKEGLFTALVKRMATKKYNFVCSQPLEGEPKQVLRNLADRILTENINDSEYLEFVRLIIAESGNYPDLSKLFLNQVAKPAVEIVTKYLQENPELNLEDPEATARIFVGSLVYFILNQKVLHGIEVMPMTAERYVDNLVALIVRKERV